MARFKYSFCNLFITYLLIIPQYTTFRPYIQAFYGLFLPLWRNSLIIN
jgi:hypothetical protein